MEEKIKENCSSEVIHMQDKLMERHKREMEGIKEEHKREVEVRNDNTCISERDVIGLIVRLGTYLSVIKD